MNKCLYRVLVLLAVFAVVLPSTSALSAKDWKMMKKEEKREQINGRADKNLAALLEKSPTARELFETANGWAAFHNLKLGAGVTAGGGKGVAVGKITGERVYMEMGTAGVGASLVRLWIVQHALLATGDSRSRGRGHCAAGNVAGGGIG